MRDRGRDRDPNHRRRTERDVMQTGKVDRKTERNRQTARQIDRQTDIQIYNYTNRQTEEQKDKLTDSHRQSDGSSVRHRNRPRGDRQSDSLKEIFLHFLP